MASNEKYPYLVRSNQNIYRKFYLDSNRNLCVEEYNGEIWVKTLLRNHVIDFSVDIDKYDKIHIIYITPQGEMKYTFFPLSGNDKTLANLNLKSGSIQNLSLKVIGYDIHIFYMIRSNYKSLRWSIYHSFWHSNNWKSTKITDVISKNTLIPYSIDINKNNLYILYSKDSDKSFGIKRFNLDFFIWSDFEENIMLDGAHNISFIIDNNGYACISFNSPFDRIVQTVMIYRDLNKKVSQWSNYLMLSQGSMHALYPSIYCDDTETCILWEEEDKIYYKKSEFSPEKLSDKIQLSEKVSTFLKCIYLSNFRSDKKVKSTFVYFDNTSIPEMISKKTSLKIDFTDAYIQEKINPDSNIFEQVSIKENYIRELQLLLNEKDKQLSLFSDTNEKLKLELNKYIDSYKATLANYEKRIANLEEEKSQLVIELNERITTLNNSLKEKELSIEKINELSLELGKKQQSIEKINTLLNSLYKENSELRDSLSNLRNSHEKGFKKFFK